MFSIERLTDAIESIALVDTAAGTRAVLAPSRGAIVTRLTVRGREVLYLDEATLRDPTKNVRGGIPVLFPSPGKLANDAWSHNGKSGHLKQHGFARNLPWREVASSTEGAASLTLELVDDASTRAEYPFAFALRIGFSLSGSTLSLAIEVENRGDDAMSFGVGFHPYFAVPSAAKKAARIPTQATHAFDNVTKERVALPQSNGRTLLDLTAKEVDLHLERHGGTSGVLEREGGNVTLRGSAEFGHWVIWTLEGKDFVCLEPWTCPGNALNTGDRLTTLEAGGRTRMSLAIEA